MHRYLLVGASDGIELALVQRLIEGGAHVVGVSRSAVGRGHTRPIERSSPWPMVALVAILVLAMRLRLWWS